MLTRRLRVLFISYYCPPAGGPGVQRFENLLRHLPPEIEATVLTAGLRDYEELSPLAMPLDASRFLPPGPIERVPAGLPYGAFRRLAGCRLYGLVRWWYLPDVARGWAHRVVEVAARFHHEHPFDVLFSTAPPFSAALAGRDCARRLGLPWVSDFRDLWTGYLRGAWPTRFHFERELALEQSVVRQATVSVMVTPGSREWMLCRHPFLAPERVDCVTNGYLASDFPAPALAAKDKLVIVHLGSLFEADEKASFLRRWARGRSFRPRRVDLGTNSLAPLIEALGRMADPRIEVRHVGPPLGSLPGIRCLGYRPRREALAELGCADAAYLPLPTVHDEPRNELVPLKTYEYLGGRLPVLAPIQNGDARDLLEQAGVGLCSSPSDPAALCTSLRCLLDWKFAGAPRPFAPREDLLHRLEWPRLAARLAEHLERAASRASLCVG